MAKSPKSSGLAVHPLAPGENRTVAKPWPSSRWKTEFSPRGVWSAPVQSTFSPEVNKWLITVAVMLAAGIEVLDMTIANVALDHIRGSFSAGVDEAAWVLTSYFVANATTVAGSVLTSDASAFFSFVLASSRSPRSCVEPRRICPVSCSFVFCRGQPGVP